MLRQEYFEHACELTDFVNRNHIRKESIQQIVATEIMCGYCGRSNYTIFYWD